MFVKYKRSNDRHEYTRVEHKPRAVGVNFSIIIVITQPGIITTTIKTHKSRHQPNKISM